MGSNDLIGMATLLIPSMASLVHQPAQAQARVDLGSQILMRPQHDATGTRKDVTGGRGSVEGHFTFTLVDRPATDPQEARHRAETVQMTLPLPPPLPLPLPLPLHP